MSPIPEGYQQVHEGSVQLGDIAWSEGTQGFFEITEDHMSLFGFMDATDVQEFYCVARKI